MVCGKSYCGYGNGLKTSDVKVRTTRTAGTLILGYANQTDCFADFKAMAQTTGGPFQNKIKFRSIILDFCSAALPNRAIAHCEGLRCGLTSFPRR